MKINHPYFLRILIISVLTLLPLACKPKSFSQLESEEGQSELSTTHNRTTYIPELQPKVLLKCRPTFFGDSKRFVLMFGKFNDTLYFQFAGYQAQEGKWSKCLQRDERLCGKAAQSWFKRKGDYYGFQSQLYLLRESRNGKIDVGSLTLKVDPREPSFSFSVFEEGNFRPVSARSDCKVSNMQQLRNDFEFLFNLQK